MPSLHILVDENIPQDREVFSAYGTVTTFHGRKLERTVEPGSDT